MSDPNTPGGPSSLPPRDPSGPASDEFGYSSDATQLWGPEDSSQTSTPSSDAPVDQVVGAAAPQPTPPEGPATPGQAPASSGQAAFEAGETAPWPTVDAPPAAWTDAAGGIGGSGAAAPEPGTGARTSGPEPWEAPQSPGALHTASLARGVSAGRPQPPGGAGPSKGRPVAIVGGVIGAAVVVAAGAWFLLFNPGRDNTTGANPTPTPTAIVTHEPTATSEPTIEPTEEPTPAPTAFRAPRFTGRNVDEAEDLAATGGLQLRFEFDETSDEPDGTVLDQDPAPGAAVRPGDTIVLTVARTSPTAPVAVPDLRGVAEDDALGQLLDLGLQPGARAEAFDAEVAQGAVVSTDPGPGAELPPGAAVDYVVSLGPEPTPTPEPTPAPVAVPDLRGVAEDDALGQLLDLGLQPGARAEAFDAEVAQGAVVSTDPGPGAELPPGAAVDYVVSLGPEPTPTPEPTPAPVAVPDLRGVAEDDALGQLLDLGLQPGARAEAFDAEVAQGAVVSTDPGPGAELPPGAAVDYVVSLGPEPTPTPEPTPAPVAVPDLRGVAEDDALGQLLDLGLQPGARAEAFDAEVAQGAVVSTDPGPGAELPPGAAVDYVVSLGPEPTPTPEPTPAPVAVPDLRGVAEDDALGQLLDLGLQPGARAEAFDAEVAQGAVVSTDPGPGAELPPGAAVDYVVSLGPEPTPTPEPTPAPVAVPDLRGVAEDDALGQLLDLGLQPGARAEAFDAEVAQGAVVSTDPGPGAELPPGAAVDYVVSLGPEPTPTPEPTPAPVAVPDLRGVAEDDALGQLLDLGLQPGARAERFHDSVDAGSVIRTDPPAGTEVAAGTTVDYVVSRGPEPTPAPVAVPDLRGVAEDDALGQLLDLGLQPGARERRFHDSVARGRVIRTDPPAGTEVAAGTTIDYVVSKGPGATPTPEPTLEPVEVPNLRGFSPEDAVSALLDANLTPGERRNRFHDSVPRGQVIRTNPAAGERVDVGTTVDYVVSRGPQPTEEPTPEPTEEPTAEPTESTASAQTVIDEVATQVQAIRELDAKDDVPYREISRRQFRAEIERRFDEENPARRVASEEAFLKRLGLIPDDMDLRETLLSLYESQVAAFYDPTTGAMTVIGDQGDLGPADRLFISHEYDHALQDQHWGLEDVMDVKPSQGDRALARLALIEGDATNVMYQWAMENLGPDDIADLADEVSSMDQDLLNEMPPILRRQLEMPYLEGQAFVAALRQAGGWDAVNDAWEHLPASTEQILHPDRYPSDKPASIELPDIAAAMGDGWTLRYTMTLGELGMRVLLADGGAESDVAPAAEGWGGDRLMMVDGPSDSWVIVWQTAWDSDEDAREFVGAASLDGVTGVHAVLPGTDLTGKQSSPVLVLVASDDATLAAVQDALGVSTVVLQ